MKWNTLKIKLSFYLYINKMQNSNNKEKWISLNHQKIFSKKYEYEYDYLMRLKNNILESWSKIIKLNSIIIKLIFMIKITETSKNQKHLIFKE
jgi:hypothetical protein